MPSVSKAQQRLMAMALHNPGAIYKKNRGVLSMDKDDIREFAETKRKGLPKHKKKKRWTH